jgi:hypothetical protein
MFDLGRYWNFWHILWPGYWNLNSALFETALCISIYILVMWIEFSPVFMEKWGLNVAKEKLSKVLFFFIALGVHLRQVFILVLVSNIHNIKGASLYMVSSHATRFHSHGITRAFQLVNYNGHRHAVAFNRISLNATIKSCIKNNLDYRAAGAVLYPAAGHAHGGTRKEAANVRQVTAHIMLAGFGLACRGNARFFRNHGQPFFPAALRQGNGIGKAVNAGESRIVFLP